ncbi:MAG: CYTH domain-containing protein, partial [Gemmatimonadales bacterium]
SRSPTPSSGPSSMREVEVKAVASEPEAVVAALVAVGAELAFAGHLADSRYDTSPRTLIAKDHVLRVRVYSGPRGSRACLDWKGPTDYEGGYKIREEVSTDVGDVGALAQLLEGLGYNVIREIDRDIEQFSVRGAMVRIERYPRMDALVEVEGTPARIEAAIAATGLPRDAFTAERLPEFVRRFERRTGQRAALCNRELAGDYRFSVDDA